MIKKNIQQDSTAELYTVDDVAKLAKCSTRSIYRMVDAGNLPEPMRIGTGRGMLRWPSHVIHNAFGLVESVHA
jgi:excisionase family DNA binding protein